MMTNIEIADLDALPPDELFTRLTLMASLVGNGVVEDLLGMEMIGVALAPHVGRTPWTAPPTIVQGTAHVLKAVIEEALRLRLGEPEVRAERWRKQLEALRVLRDVDRLSKTTTHRGGREAVVEELIRDGMIEDTGLYKITKEGRQYLARLEEWGQQGV